MVAEKSAKSVARVLGSATVGSPSLSYDIDLLFLLGGRSWGWTSWHTLTGKRTRLDNPPQIGFDRGRRWQWLRWA